jgi:hypothetical protein
MVESDGAAAEEDEGECEGGQCQGEFVSAGAHQSVVEVDLGDGDGQIDEDGESSYTSEQAEEDEQSAKKLCEGGEVGSPARESEAGDEVGVVVKSAEKVVISVAEHDSAQGEAHDKKRQGLQAVEVAQVVPPSERRIDYSSGAVEGKSLAWE